MTAVGLPCRGCLKRTAAGGPMRLRLLSHSIFYQAMFMEKEDLSRREQSGLAANGAEGGELWHGKAATLRVCTFINEVNAKRESQLVRPAADTKLRGTVKRQAKGSEGGECGHLINACGGWESGKRMQRNAEH